jgi:hypothetical protein
MSGARDQQHQNKRTTEAKLLRMILFNQRQQEARNPSGVPVQGMCGVPGTKWKLLDSRMTDKEGVSKGDVCYLNGCDAYRTYCDASDAYSGKMQVVGRYPFPTTRGGGDETLSAAQVWPPQRGTGVAI